VQSWVAKGLKRNERVVLGGQHQRGSRDAPRKLQRARGSVVAFRVPEPAVGPVTASSNCRIVRTPRRRQHEIGWEEPRLAAAAPAARE
jgi:hypothetical protein